MTNPEQPEVANVETAEQRKQQIAAALEKGDYATVARLAQEEAEAKAASEAAAVETMPVAEPAESEEAKAAREAVATQQAALQKQQDTQKAAEILAKLQADAGVSPPAETAPVENQESKEMSPAVQEVILKMKKQGYYLEKLSALKPGEVPSEQLATNMISSAIYGLSESASSSSGFSPEDVEVLINNLPFDREKLKEWVMKKFLEDLSADDVSLKKLELSGVNPAEYHDKAKELLPQMLYLVAGDRGEIRKPKDVKKWRDTFGISDEEYADALRNYYQQNNNSISRDHVLSLGFLKAVDNNPNNLKWAWE
jgi:hypothetical protein